MNQALTVMFAGLSEIEKVEPSHDGGAIAMQAIAGTTLNEVKKIALGLGGANNA